MSLDPTQVARIATLARIRVPQEALAGLAGELNGIMAWIEQLNEVDVTGIEPMTGAVARDLPLREDAVTDGGDAERILRNAPEPAHGFFTVPKVVE